MNQSTIIYLCNQFSYGKLWYDTNDWKFQLHWSSYKLTQFLSYTWLSYFKLFQLRGQGITPVINTPSSRYSSNKQDSNLYLNHTTEKQLSFSNRKPNYVQCNSILWITNFMTQRSFITSSFDQWPRYIACTSLPHTEAMTYLQWGMIAAPPQNIDKIVNVKTYQKKFGWI